MAQENTAAPVATDSTAPQVIAEATATAPAVAPVVVPAEKPLAEQSKDENKAALLAKLAASKTARAAQPAAAAPAAEAAAETPIEVAAVVKETPAASTETDPAAAALLKLARDGQRLAREREKFRAEQTAARAQVERETQAAAAARERLAKIEQARASGDELAILRASGLTNDQIRGPFVVNLLERMKREEEAESGQGAPGLTEARAREIFVAQRAEEQRLAQEEQRLANEKASQAQREAIERDRNAYFAGIATEFKTGKYPLVAAIQPTHAELDAHFVEHFKTTGERLTPQQLLGAFETRYKAAGVTIAPKTTPAKPTKQTSGATSRTIGARAVEDAGDTIVTPQKTGGRSMDDIRAEGKAKALAAIAAKHAR